MINKNSFLSDVGCTHGRLAKEINELIFNWHNLSKINVEPNEIDESLIDSLRLGVIYWKNLISSEAEGFRDRVGRRAFHKLLKRVIEGNESINYFGILCPSYKKGLYMTGFADKPGNTTHRAFCNLERMLANTRSLGIKCDSRMFYADISIENYQELSKKDLDDFRNNIFLDEIIAKEHNIPFYTLTQFIPELDVIVGKAGRLCPISSLDINPKAFERSLWRDKRFYPRNFGWSIEEAKKRTIIHAHSYYWQGEYMRKKLSYPVMIYSAYDYEKAGLYNGKNGDLWPSVMFPIKEASNPPISTIPIWKKII